MFVWPEPNLEFTPGVSPPDAEGGWYFVFKGGDIYQSIDDAGRWQPLSQKPEQNIVQSHYLGDIAGTHCHAVEVDSGEDFTGLRALFGKTDHLMFSLAGRAVQVLDWYRTHQYCGQCGAPTTVHEKDRATTCGSCKAFYYPRLSPSIITLVHRGDEMLLARNHRFPKGMFSTLAGFVEPGESIEETVRREVFEEVGVKVGNLEYMGSQPWPFPNSLMLGFLAEYESGDLVLQEDEISEAGWFHHTELPDIPGPVAISRWLIDAHLDRLRS
jgi:NAD+ diphosphatase